MSFETSLQIRQVEVLEGYPYTYKQDEEAVYVSSKFTVQALDKIARMY